MALHSALSLYRTQTRATRAILSCCPPGSPLRRLHRPQYEKKNRENDEEKKINSEKTFKIFTEKIVNNRGNFGAPNSPRLPLTNRNIVTVLPFLIEQLHRMTVTMFEKKSTMTLSIEFIRLDENLYTLG